MAGKLAFIWYGPVYTLGGYGSVSRLFVSNLVKLGFKVKVVSYGGGDKSKLDKSMVKLLEDCEHESIPIGYTKILVLHQLPHNIYPLRVKGVDYSVLMTIFETDSIPKIWASICNKKMFDEIWIPTMFNFKTFSKAGVEKNKLRIVNYGLESTNKKSGTRYVKKDGRFRFLYIADLIPRKNIPLLVEAFGKEFGSNPNVELFIQLSYSNQAALDEFISKYNNLLKHSNIFIGKDRLNEAEIGYLIESSDVYISVDRANGWGMPCMEAMSKGILSATIDWSGSTEFMKKDNSLLIKPSRLELVDSYSASLNPIYCGQKWAHVSENDIRKTLRYAYMNRGKLGKLSKKGAEDMQTRFNMQGILNRLIEDLTIMGIENKNSELYIKCPHGFTVLFNKIKVVLRYNVNYFIIYRSPELLLKESRTVFRRLKLILVNR